MSTTLQSVFFGVLPGKLEPQTDEALQLASLGGTLKREDPATPSVCVCWRPVTTAPFQGLASRAASRKAKPQDSPRMHFVHTSVLFEPAFHVGSAAPLPPLAFSRRSVHHLMPLTQIAKLFKAPQENQKSKSIYYNHDFFKSQLLHKK